MSTSLLPAPRAALLTADEFVVRYENERVELVKGVVEELPMPGFKHGKICFLIAQILSDWIDANDWGQIAVNNSWMRTQRTPDSVRGPDVMCISYTRQPRGPLPDGLLTQSPELVVEVRSPSDSWSKLLQKGNEYLGANVQIVILIDPEVQTATVLRGTAPPETYSADQELKVPDLLPGFACAVGKLFE